MNRRLAPLAVLLAALTVAGCTGQAQPSASCDVAGAWEVVSLTLTNPDGQATEVEISDPPGLKVLSDDGHWAFVEQTGDNANPTSGGGGRYAVEDGQYVEYVDYHAAADFIGERIAFDCRVEGDRWYQTGMLPGGTYLEEVFQRAGGQPQP